MELYDEDTWKLLANQISTSDDFRLGKTLYARDFLPQTFLCAGREQVLQYIRLYETDIFVEVLINTGKDICFVPVTRNKKKDILIKITNMYGYEGDELCG